MKLLGNLLVLSILAALAGPVFAADLFLAEEPEVYAAIDRLSASGYLPGFLANTRPYPLEAVREALRRSSGTELAKGIDSDLLRWLSWYTGPAQTARITASASRSDARFVPWNQEGIPTPDRWSGQASIIAREEKTPFFSGQLRAASFFGEGGDNGNRLLDAAIEIGYPYASVQAGKISTWYGPGRHGALLFTNNAQPYPGVRIRNPVPIRPSGRLSFLGSFQYEFFAARLEKRAQHSHPVLTGTRLAVQPRPWIEIGLSRVLHYGGDDRSNGISEFLDDYFGSNDPSDRSNTIGGWDLTLTLPFPSQPVQLYMERGAEDSSHWGKIFFPWDDRFANLLGIYLPRLFLLSRLDLRAEYADNFWGENRGDNWYGHPAYPHTYRGEILGHPMGGSSRDWFVQSRYWFLPTAWGRISWEKVLHDGGPSAGERHTLWSAGLGGWITEKWRAEAGAIIDRAGMTSGLPGPSGTEFSARITVSYQVTELVPWTAGGI